MKTGRVHMRIEQSLIDRVQEIAKRQNVSVTSLVEQFFQELVKTDDSPKPDEEFGVEQA